ncbi:putative F-box/leucine rich repeat protein [Ixodes scapularis]
MADGKVLSLLKAILNRRDPAQDNPVQGTSALLPPAHELLEQKKGLNPLWRITTSEKCKVAVLTVSPTEMKQFLKQCPAQALPWIDGLSLHSKGIQEQWNIFISSTKMERLRSICPSVQQLSLEGFNLADPYRKRRSKLKHFPAKLRVLSFRNCIVDIKRLFSKVAENCALVTLDLGRCFFVSDDASRVDQASPSMLSSLRELYLEGYPFLDPSFPLGHVLRVCPSLQVLDIEGTTLGSHVILELVALNLPELRELYVGWTNVRDSSVLALTSGQLANLLTVCLVGTKVTNLGLLALCCRCPRLKTLRVDRVWCNEALLEEAKSSLAPNVQVEWCSSRSDNVNNVLRHEGCEHFRERASRPAFT